MLQYTTLRTWHVMIPCLTASDIQAALTKYALNRCIYMCCFLRFDICVQYGGQDPINPPSPLSTVFDTSN